MDRMLGCITPRGFILDAVVTVNIYFYSLKLRDISFETIRRILKNCNVTAIFVWSVEHRKIFWTS
ncbi:hypothetical protein T4B_4656 [Trichinella pseudospiralis]|uniref:Uncharacterized protein n=1 Tax=Trichinella pseudospiralis TaxID=6337 RepID=A0A0V1I7W3_TRIPS|nr:hypothetical protein T4B_4656 [Trichinella pseudospiralis]KRZ39768.1 hypothetical protein T4C_6842 [Trichinella pseudospiralis]